MHKTISILLFFLNVQEVLAEDCPGILGRVIHANSPLYEEPKEGAKVLSLLPFSYKLCTAGKRDRYILVPRRFYTGSLESSSESDFFGVLESDIEIEKKSDSQGPLAALRRWFYRMANGIPPEDALDPYRAVVDIFRKNKSAPNSAP